MTDQAPRRYFQPALETSDNEILEEKEEPQNSDPEFHINEDTPYTAASYKAAVKATVNWVTHGKFILGPKDKKVDFKLYDKLVFYPSKGTPSIPKGQNCGLGTQKPGNDPHAFIRIDWDPIKLVHFNAIYVGNNESIPKGSDEKPCSVTIANSKIKKELPDVLNTIKGFESRGPQALWDNWYGIAQAENGLNE